MGRYINNTNICVRMKLIPFVGVSLLSTHIDWLILAQVEEIISSFGSEFTFMSGFGTLEFFVYGSWSDSLFPVR